MRLSLKHGVSPSLLAWIIDPLATIRRHRLAMPVKTDDVWQLREHAGRRFPLPWTVEKIPGGFKVVDANQQALAYAYSRETKADADIAKVLTEDELRRISRSYQHC